MPRPDMRMPTEASGAVCETHSGDRGSSPIRISLGLVFLLAFIFFIAPAFALSAGHYTDYHYSSDYVPPVPPAPLEINCTFFHPDDTTCTVLDTLPNASQNAVTLGLIRRATPEDNQDWVRYWDSQLPMGGYFENISANATDADDHDGEWGTSGSLRNTWMRLVNLYPSVLDEKDSTYYVSDQTLMTVYSNLDFVIPTPSGAGSGEYCAQSYQIDGYDMEIVKTIGNYSTHGVILPIKTLLTAGEKAVLNLTLDATGRYGRTFSKWQNQTVCDEQFNCNISTVCVQNSSDRAENNLSLNLSVPIKRYPTLVSIDHRVAVPKAGFSQGLVRLLLPNDFLYYELTVKGQTVRVSKNDLKFVRHGAIFPIIGMHLIPAPGTSGTLHVVSMNESVDGSMYSAELRYRLLLDSPNLGQSDCDFKLVTPFGVEDYNGSCLPVRTTPRLALEMHNSTNKTVEVWAVVSDQLGNRLSDTDVELVGGAGAGGSIGLGAPVRNRTNESGVALFIVGRHESTQTVTVDVVGNADVAGAQANAFVPGIGADVAGGFKLGDIVGGLAPIFLLVVLVTGLMAWAWRKRSSPWVLIPFLLLLAALLPALYAQSNSSDTGSGGLDVQATLNACKNYDFTNAVQHLGECIQASQVNQEFNSLRRTSAVLVSNIAPLVVANPDIAPYKAAYGNMVLIALSLFRVSWAFNSLYLLLNIFNPGKRSDALKNYIWLIVFVIFVYASFTVMQSALTAVNAVASWVAGTEAAQTLQQASLSVQFVAENFEMLKLMLPFLNLTYLILLARYITVIGMILFFPFSLLLFFTSATRGFGQATLTVTFAALGLGIINAILLLIYNILVRTADPALTGSFATTFFSASFIVFFGFVNLLVLCVAFLSGIIFIGQSKGMGS